MKAKELVGKLAIRTAPNKTGDWSYTDQAVLIVNVTDNHIYAKRGDRGEVRDLIFNKRFLDGNWDLFENVVPKPWSDEIIERMSLDILNDWGEFHSAIGTGLDYLLGQNSPSTEKMIAETIKEAIKLDLSDNTKSFEQFKKEMPNMVIFAPPLDKIKVTVKPERSQPERHFEGGKQ